MNRFYSGSNQKIGSRRERSLSLAGLPSWQRNGAWERAKTVQVKLIDLSNQSAVRSMFSISTYGAWLGVIACILQSGLFAGLNLAVFSLSLLRLQIEADAGNIDAVKVLDLRKNANQVLATVIWGMSPPTSC